MSHAHTGGRVLSIYLFSRGFSAVVFEGPLSPVDRVICEIRGREKNARCLDAIAKFIEECQPDTLLIEDYTVTGAGRSARLRRLYRAIETLAQYYNLDLRRCSRKAVKQAFAKAGAATKYEIAQVVAKLLPALAYHMPRPRKAWMSEDLRMSLFDAAAQALVFFHADIDDVPRTP